jgi:hypothetical protein
VYGRAIALFRNWALQNLVPGPDILAITYEKQLTGNTSRILIAQIEAVSRDGRSVQAFGRRDLVVPLDTAPGAPDLTKTALTWGKRTLERDAPWAATGLVTVRAIDFGLDGLAAIGRFAEADLRYSEDIPQGIERALGAIAGLYRGENTGKRLIRIR